VARLTEEEIETLRCHPEGTAWPSDLWAILERAAAEEGLCCPWGVLNAYGIGRLLMHSH